MSSTIRKRQAYVLKVARKVHRTTGAILFVFFFIVAVTGLLLGWKKHSGGLILPKSYAGKSTDPKDWLPIHVLREKAFIIAREQISPDLPLDLDRIDIRPDKGMVKFVFIHGYWGLQIDCTTGELLHLERRRSDLIETIHDGSFFAGDWTKLGLFLPAGATMLLLWIGGLWMWWVPFIAKRRRAAHRRHP